MMISPVLLLRIDFFFHLARAEKTTAEGRTEAKAGSAAGRRGKQTD